jgi:hypothetical protein
MKTQAYLLILPALIAAGCSNGNNNSSAAAIPAAAVVATVAPDYSSGAVTLAQTSAPFNVENNLDATTSDIAVRAAGDHFFLIKRYGTDQIQRYEAATPTTPTYTYSTNDPPGTQDSNPYDIVVLNETKAYLIRYGSGTIWIVNPSATSEANFMIGTIDLSQYNSDGIPEMSAGVINNGKLYVAMQRLQNFAATQDGYVAVIDTNTDTEIDTTGGSGATLLGIDIGVRDPFRLVSVPGSDSVIVGADGGYDASGNPQYFGGIVSIDPDNGYQTTLLVSDTTSNTANPHPFGYLSDVTLAANDRGYFIGGAGYGLTQSLFRFDPTTAAFTPVGVADFQGLELSAISVDPSGNLWVGQTPSTPGLSVLGFQNGTETVVEPLIDTSLNPLNIDFLTVSTQ